MSGIQNGDLSRWTPPVLNDTAHAPSHRQEAERLLRSVGHPCMEPDEARLAVERAQVHATLAMNNSLQTLIEAVESLRFPELEIKKDGAGLSSRFRIRPQR